MTASTPRRRHVVQRLVFWLVLVVLVVAVIEALAWLAWRPITGTAFGPVAVTTTTAEMPDVRPGREQAGLGFRDDAMSLHPYLGYVYTPRPPGESGRIPISEDGFLDDRSCLRQRRDDTVLVGIVGGSVAGQLGTWHHERLRQELAGVPSYAGRRIELVRLGMPGYHQPQQVQQLVWILAQGGELDVLINLDGFNEVAVTAALNLPQGVHALYPMNWSMVALDVPDLELRRSIGAVSHLQQERLERAEAFRHAPWSRSILARLLWKVQDDRLASAQARHAWAVQRFRVDDVPYFVRGPAHGHPPESDRMPWCVAVWKRSSLALQALCDANGIRYLHVLQPNQYLPGSKPLSAEEQASAWDPHSPYRSVVEHGYPLLRAAGRELAAAGVDFLDLSQLFEAQRATFYVDNCCHFNAEGNALLARALAAALSS